MSELRIINAVKSGDLNKIRELIDSGDDIHQKDEQGWTPLNWAAGKGELTMVTLLIEAGADVFAVGRDNRTARSIALAASHIDVARFLKEAEENVDLERSMNSRKLRKYCKAYPLSRLRQFRDWSEKPTCGKDRAVDANSKGDEVERNERSADDIVFIHQDYSVTQSAWHNEDVIFEGGSEEWKEFCENELKFRVPDEFDLPPPPSRDDAKNPS